MDASAQTNDEKVRFVLQIEQFWAERQLPGRAFRVRTCQLALEGDPVALETVLGWFAGYRQVLAVEELE